MTPPRRALASVPAVPWANGRGTTRELLRRQMPDGRILVRLSVADIVEPGPFSILPGLDRVLVAIDGPGFTLTVDGRSVAVNPLETFSFAGEAAVAVTAVAGASRDFNVMTARALVRAEVLVHRGPFTAPGGSLVFVVAGAFTCPLDPAPYGAGELADLDAASGATPFHGHGVAILVAIFPA